MKDKKPEGESNILVAIRVRPLNPKEVNSGDRNIIRHQDNLIVNHLIYLDYFRPSRQGILTRKQKNA